MKQKPLLHQELSPQKQAALTSLDRDVVDQIFDVFVRDYSEQAVTLHGKTASTEAQQVWALEHVRKPVGDPLRFGRVWQQVLALVDAYAMRP